MANTSQPSVLQFRGSLSRKFLVASICSVLLAASVAGFLIEQRGKPLAVVCLVVGVLLIVLLVDIALQITGLARNYTVDQDSLWLGRGKHPKLLLRWADVQRWEIRVRHKRGHLATLETAAHKLRVEECEVEVPGFETFVDAVTRHAPVGPYRRDVVPTARVKMNNSATN